MIKKIKFWLEASRWYALPMSIFSWLVIFSYSLQQDGNPINGVIALAGICFAHLATNLFDDFCDYNFFNNNFKSKHLTLTNDDIKSIDILKTVCIFCLMSLLIGGYFYFNGYKDVIIYILLGAVVVLGYSLLSNIRLSEIAVGLAFGPILFGGVYYVMTGKTDVEVFILAIPSTIMTINLLYTDNFLDKENDLNIGKKTIAGLLANDERILKCQKGLILSGYLSVLLLPIFDISDWEVFFVAITVPLVFDLLESLYLYSNDKTKTPTRKWFHFPFEGISTIAYEHTRPYMFRMYQARNLMIYFALILSAMIWFG